MTKQDNIDAAREHYKTRASRRPKQTWDKINRVWVKS